MAKECLPTKEDLYSVLAESDISDGEYEHAVKIWEHFEYQSLGEYLDLYLKMISLLLADIFENFQGICMATYNLDLAYYYTAPFDYMLKYNKTKLELLTNYDLLLMIEKSILFYLL